MCCAACDQPLSSRQAAGIMGNGSDAKPAPPLGCNDGYACESTAAAALTPAAVCLRDELGLKQQLHAYDLHSKRRWRWIRGRWRIRPTTARGCHKPCRNLGHYGQGE